MENKPQFRTHVLMYCFVFLSIYNAIASEPEWAKHVKVSVEGKPCGEIFAENLAQRKLNAKKLASYLREESQNRGLRRPFLWNPQKNPCPLTAVYFTALDKGV